MSKSRLPARFRFGGAWRTLRLPDEPLLLADFVNVVLDDDYGLRTLKAPPRSIVDVGGNVGLFTAYAREQFPHSTIHIYEPSPTTADYARSIPSTRIPSYSSKAWLMQRAARR